MATKLSADFVRDGNLRGTTAFHYLATAVGKARPAGVNASCGYWITAECGLHVWKRTCLDILSVCKTGVYRQILSGFAECLGRHFSMPNSSSFGKAKVYPHVGKTSPQAAIA